MRATATAARSKRVDVLLALAIAGAGGGGTNPNALPYVVARPIDGVTDDWPSFMGPGGVVAKAALKGQDVIMMPGLLGQPWVCKTPNLQVPSNVTIIGTPETVINQTLNPAGGVGACAFGGVEASPASGGLAVNIVIGDIHVHSLTDVGPAGGSIVVSTNGGLNAQLFTVISRTGAAPNIDYVVDRPVLVAATTASLALGRVSQVNGYPTHINIFGNGMVMNGTGEAFVHWSPGTDCNVYDINMTGDPVNTLSCVQYDVASFDSDVQRIRTFNSASGFVIASAQNIRLESSRAAQMSSFGFGLEDALEIFVTNCEADTCNNQGLLFDASPGSPGTMLSVVSGGSYNSSIRGIQINNTSNRNHVTGVRCIGNSTGGLTVEAGAVGAPASNTMTGVNCSNNTVGFLIASGTQTVLEGCQANDNVNTDLQASANIRVTGFTSRFSGVAEAHPNVNMLAGQSTFVNVSIQTTANDGLPFQLAGTAKASVTDANLTMDGGGAPTAFQVSGTSNLSLENISIGGLATVIGINGNTGTTTRIGQNVNLSVKAGAFAFNITTPGAFINKSFIAGTVSGGPPPFTANGTTAVNVPFTDLRLEDTVLIQLEAGTVAAGIAPGKLVQNPGVGFTYTGSAVTDLGVYSWRIIG